MAARPATSSGPTVVICSQAAPGRMAGAVSRMTSATAAPSKSMVMTTSAPLDGGGGGGGDLDAIVGQGLGTRDRAVPGAHGVAGAGDVASHRRAHDSGAEYGYSQLRHASPLIVSNRAVVDPSVVGHPPGHPPTPGIGLVAALRTRP